MVLNDLRHNYTISYVCSWHMYRDSIGSETFNENDLMRLIEIMQKKLNNVMKIIFQCDNTCVKNT